MVETTTPGHMFTFCVSFSYVRGSSTASYVPSIMLPLLSLLSSVISQVYRHSDEQRTRQAIRRSSQRSVTRLRYYCLLCNRSVSRKIIGQTSHLIRPVIIICS